MELDKKINWGYPNEKGQIQHVFPYGWVLNFKLSVGLLLSHRGYVRERNYWRREGSSNIWELEYMWAERRVAVMIRLNGEGEDWEDKQGNTDGMEKFKGNFRGYMEINYT